MKEYLEKTKLLDYDNEQR